MFIFWVLALLSAEPSREGLLTGTWVADLTSQQGLPTDVYVVHGGTYKCVSCVPARKYPSDGKMRTVVEVPPVSEAVTIIDARTISTRIVEPGLVRTTTMRVAPDGQTAVYVSLDRRQGIEGLLRTEYLARRVAPGPAGSHAVSGSWQGVRYVSVPLQLRTTILSEDGEQFSYRTGTGYSYTASYQGSFVPISGPYDGSTSVSVRKVSPYRVVETRRRGGQEIQTRTYTVGRNGQVMEIATMNPVTNTTFRVTARRQGRARRTPR